MNFYIADSINEINTINEINISDDNIEFSDELLDFIYKSSSKVSFDMSKLYEVDPYADVEIAHKDLPRIIEICDYILNKSLLEDYDEKDEGNEMLLNLVVIAKKSNEERVGLGFYWRLINYQERRIGNEVKIRHPHHRGRL